jgi:UPF0755 protein
MCCAGPIASNRESCNGNGRSVPKGLPYQTAYEALVLASIVEKETGQAADRPLVASVFVNRLRGGMLLADRPDRDLRYRTGDFDGDLRKRDLADRYAL